jgi:hypothetical protein
MENWQIFAFAIICGFIILAIAYWYFPMYYSNCLGLKGLEYCINNNMSYNGMMSMYGFYCFNNSKQISIRFIEENYKECCRKKAMSWRGC